MTLPAQPLPFATDDDEAMVPAPLGGVIRQRDFLSPQMNLNDRTVLITGGTGSFGRQFVKLVIQRFKPRRLIVFSRDELKQYEMASQFPQDRYPFMRYFIGDIRNRDRLELALRDVDYVIHAAAMKQVPVAEYNPSECIATNIMGAENVVHSALRRGVKRVIALSTDKAANPVNLYGASKLASDKIFVAANNLSGADGCRFSVVRYGNVVGSRGSVMPFFRKLIDERADALPITDDRMTRFWITLNQGVNFVLSSMALMKGGEIFVPKIPSMSMTELARSLAPHMAHKIIGVRPGEKLHEIMITSDDARQTLELDDRYVILPSFFQDLRGDYVRQGARPVGQDFSYASDSNPERLDARGLQHMLAEAYA
jgi:UDP-N-acetylglucosamine 4,6-dehydratase/5-epimerase